MLKENSNIHQGMGKKLGLQEPMQPLFQGQL